MSREKVELESKLFNKILESGNLRIEKERTIVSYISDEKIKELPKVYLNEREIQPYNKEIFMKTHFEKEEKNDMWAPLNKEEWMYHKDLELEDGWKKYSPYEYNNHYYGGDGFQVWEEEDFSWVKKSDGYYYKVKQKEGEWLYYISGNDGLSYRRVILQILTEEQYKLLKELKNE